MRNRLPSPAMIVALAALLFAVTGSAIAAKHYLITSKRQIAPKVLKSLKGKRGKTGVAGPAGAVGAAGATGAAGAAGAAGPLLDTLPSGRTMRGVYTTYVIGDTGQAQALAATAVTFPIALAAAPTAHFLNKGDPATTQCPGSAAAPSALAGHLCVYEGGQVANGASVISDPATQGAPGSGRYGFKVSTGAGFGGSPYGFGSWGTWAVTAP